MPGVSRRDLLAGSVSVTLGAGASGFTSQVAVAESGESLPVSADDA